MFRERISRLNLREIHYPNLVKISIIGDGSCFFHSVLRSFNKTYMSSGYMERQRMARDVRRLLAKSLIEKDPFTGKLYYESLSKGKLKEFGENWKPASLNMMFRELMSSSPVDNKYHELISEKLCKDIYFIDLVKGDLYVTSSDIDLLYKNRNSIFILVTPGHYDLMGIEENGKINTYFSPRHPFVILVKSRLEKLVKNE